MNWKEYKALCERPDYFSRYALELSIAAATSADVSRPLEMATRQAPVEKPADHRGGPETDHFRVDLDPAVVLSLLAALGSHGEADDSRTARHLRHLSVVWQEYITYKEKSDGT